VATNCGHPANVSGAYPGVKPLMLAWVPLITQLPDTWKAIVKSTRDMFPRKPALDRDVVEHVPTLPEGRHLGRARPGATKSRASIVESKSLLRKGKNHQEKVW
jgi:hypothetical protein